MFNKPLITALFVSISLNCLFGYLSYSFYSDKAVAESQLETAVDANKDLKESLEKKGTACEITDVIVSDYTKEKREIVKETDGVLNAIDKMAPPEIVPKKAANAAKGAAFNVESNVVNIDGKLPPDLVRLLSESCSRARGSACDNP